MGGPAAIVYIPLELSEEEIGDVTRLFDDKSWRTSPDNHDVLTIMIEGMGYGNDAGDIVALQTALGWHPMQQIQVISHGNSDARWHVDVALGLLASPGSLMDGSRFSPEKNTTNRFPTQAFRYITPSTARTSNELSTPSGSTSSSSSTLLDSGNKPPSSLTLV